MPTFTHNRVKNGVNGKQYSNMHPGNLFQRKRVSSNPANRKFASNVVTGRSFAAKRAIGRRVARQMPVKPIGNEGRRDAEGNIILNECCMVPTATISRPVQKYSKGKTSSSGSSSGTSSGSSSGSVVSTVTGKWMANSPIDILVNIEVAENENITGNILTASVNWAGEDTEIYTINKAGIHLLSHTFDKSGPKDISISYAPGNGLEDKVKFGFKYGATDDELSQSIKDTLNEVVDDNNQKTRKDNLYTSLRSLGELPDTYTLYKGAFKGATELTEIDNVANVKLSEFLNEAFAFTKIETFPGMDEWGDKMLDVKSLEGLCKGCQNMNDPNIGKLKTDNVTNFASMFEGAILFNHPFDQNLFKTNNATNMSNMFKRAENFNNPIGHWHVDNVENMDGMFNGASEFSDDIKNWNTEKVTTMEGMFDGAEKFDKDHITNWNFDKLNSSSLTDNEIIDYIFGSGNSIDSNSDFFNKLMQKFGRDQGGDQQSNRVEDISDVIQNNGDTTENTDNNNQIENINNIELSNNIELDNSLDSSSLLKQG